MVRDHLLRDRGDESVHLPTIHNDAGVVLGFIEPSATNYAVLCEGSFSCVWLPGVAILCERHWRTTTPTARHAVLAHAIANLQGSFEQAYVKTIPRCAWCLA